MATLCPACKGLIVANPLGRWLSRFKCPHCGAILRFDQRTNLLGLMSAAAFLAAGVYLAMRGKAALGEWPFMAATFAWLGLAVSSYTLRGVERDSSRDG